MFPRLAIHTGNIIDRDNQHASWADTIVLQHNETTATILKHGPSMTARSKRRHPALSTFQSNCRGSYWAPLNTGDFFGQTVVDGYIPSATPEQSGIEVSPTIGH